MRTGTHRDSAPRWSPDSQTLEFLSDRDGKPQLYLLALGGGEARQLTTLPDGAGVPVWSPDGSALAFAMRVPLEPPPNDPQQRERWTQRLRHVTTTAYEADGAGFTADSRSQLLAVPAACGCAPAGR